MNKDKALKVLWALDALEEHVEAPEKESHFLKNLAGKTPLEIDPIYVLSPNQLGVSLEFSDPWLEKYVPAAKKALENKLKSLVLPAGAKVNPPIVLSQNRSTLRGTVDELAQFADESKSYDFILSGSHGRHGIERALLGSFAEQLLLRATIPVMVVGNKSTPSNSMGSGILLVSDLLNVRADAYREVFALAAKLAVPVKLLTVIRQPAAQVIQSGVYILSGGWITTTEYLEDERSNRSLIAREIIAEAKKQGVHCELVVDHAVSATESILRHATETQPLLVAMYAQSGPVATSLIGSVTRQVVRASPCPVWVLHHQK